MSFRFEKDYLQDLEPVLDRLRAEGLGGAIVEIERCKMAGATGGEILSCVSQTLRQTRRQASKELGLLVESYLRKAPGY